VDFDEFRKVVKLLGMYWLMVNQPPVNHAADNLKNETPLAAKQGK
jgi:hypothetical protein